MMEVFRTTVIALQLRRSGGIRFRCGESGVLPRTVKSNSVSDTQSVTCSSSSEENRNLRAVRARRKPNAI